MLVIGSRPWLPSLGPVPGSRRAVSPRISSVNDGFHPPVEEYLEAIFSMEEEGIPVIQARLAERLDKAAPSVSEMLDRLEGAGLIARSGRQIAMTVDGAALARGVVRKHRLAERLLVDVIGLPWDKAHIEAGRWEHVISDEVESKLIDLLGNPETCPHGNPIPGAGYAPPENRPLADSETGDLVQLVRVTESIEHDADALSYLGANGLTPGVSFAVTGPDDGGAFTLELAGRTVAVDPDMATRIFVAPASST